jgi:hypothetical protein
MEDTPLAPTACAFGSLQATAIYRRAVAHTTTYASYVFVGDEFSGARWVTACRERVGNTKSHAARTSSSTCSVSSAQPHVRGGASTMEWV